MESDRECLIRIRDHLKDYLSGHGKNEILKLRDIYDVVMIYELIEKRK